MRFLLTSWLVLTLLFVLGGAAQAQVTPSNSLGIFPPGGLFNPIGQFTAIGESGGVPGPTSSGCDLYGFRAQINPDLAVSLGVQRVTPKNTFFPALVFEGSNLLISGRSPSGIPSVESPTLGCGPLLAFYSTTSTTSYTIYGSANAIGGMWMASDRKLKRNIKPIRDAIETVQQLSGVTYNYNTDARPELRLGKELQYGFIAQEVEKVLPELVRPAINSDGEEDNFVVMNYDGIIPVLTEAIKEQQEIMDDQQIIMEEQELRLDQQQGFIEKQQTVIDQQQDVIAKQQLAIDQLMNRLKEVESTLGIQSDVPANQNPQGPFGEVKLNQNRPNPADGNTIIEYTLPTEIAQAQLVIFDITGAEVNRYEVQTGFGSVEIQAGELAAGTYLYTIEVEGRSVARRKMVIQ
ncbi:MAG: tail fiber domain-containing protein [Bacteroidota bacterium]